MCFEETSYYDYVTFYKKIDFWERMLRRLYCFYKRANE